jgi:hypothetical protein
MNCETVVQAFLDLRNGIAPVSSVSFVRSSLTALPRRRLSSVRASIPLGRLLDTRLAYVVPVLF